MASAQGEGSAHEHGEASLVGHQRGLVRGDGAVGERQRLVDLVQLLREYLPVFRGDDGLDGRAKHFAVVLLEDALRPQLDAHVERRLAAHADDDSVRALLLEDVLSDGQEGHLVLVLVRAGVG